MEIQKGDIDRKDRSRVNLVLVRLKLCLLAKLHLVIDKCLYIDEEMNKIEENMSWEERQRLDRMMDSLRNELKMGKY